MKLTVMCFLGLFITALVLSFGTPSLATTDLSQQIDNLAEKLASSSEGKVLDVSGPVIYINLGQQNGILPGNQFEIVRLGEPLMDGNQIIGHKETIIAQIEVFRARKQMSVCNILDKTGEPQADDKVYQLRKRIKRLVVAQFNTSQGTNGLTKNVQEKLFTALIQRGMQVVEREQLERVLSEQKLGYSGLINLDSAKKIGQLLGAEGMILGTITDMGNTISINARLVELETGNTLNASSVELPKTPMISKLISEPVQNSLFAQPIGTGTQSSSSAKQTIKKPFFENDRFRIEVITFKRIGTGIELKLKYINRTERTIKMYLFNPKENAYLVDSKGNQYPFKQSEMERNRREFPASVPRVSTIIFRDIKGGDNNFIATAKYSPIGANFFASFKGLHLSQ